MIAAIRHYARLPDMIGSNGSGPPGSVQAFLGGLAQFVT